MVCIPGPKRGFQPVIRQGLRRLPLIVEDQRILSNVLPAIP